MGIEMSMMKAIKNEAALVNFKGWFQVGGALLALTILEQIIGREFSIWLTHGGFFSVLFIFYFVIAICGIIWFVLCALYGHKDWEAQVDAQRELHRLELQSRNGEEGFGYLNSTTGRRIKAGSASVWDGIA